MYFSAKWKELSQLNICIPKVQPWVFFFLQKSIFARFIMNIIVAYLQQWQKEYKSNKVMKIAKREEVVAWKHWLFLGLSFYQLYKLTESVNRKSSFQYLFLPWILHSPSFMWLCASWQKHPISLGEESDREQNNIEDIDFKEPGFQFFTHYRWAYIKLAFLHLQLHGNIMPYLYSGIPMDIINHWKFCHFFH